MKYMQASSDFQATDENKAIFLLRFFNMIEEVDCKVELLSPRGPIEACGNISTSAVSNCVSSRNPTSGSALVQDHSRFV